ncbi:MAG: cyclic nucleotide-binding domain-containing protein [Rhodospirillaceae bacterium]|jgi:CRP-like cAMP-binding protein|nr:cyclic nucleotide-binding domain-containing protein [Rhodospirillales bacterium]MBT3904818.1 cyclic nucleotide-binding domain-containing protein [Rhodospirillaceae bacterium]MBT4702903.1 cyclic nucleotide-binding domain-containing protein [Rhodospirillaceae bacterium]MBT5035609.1 cyclic nucleotide-binding domain-containing protein [Rhodospirillaceae bacterium]MBT6219407.1 cyclic nucleotide-binding domain-containing protein [Rhodospirillaceae bacterium]
MIKKRKDTKILSRKIISKNTVIFREGDGAENAYLLKAGKVGITTNQNGEHVLLTTVLPNQLFGELALIDGSPRSATAIAIEESEVVIVGPEDIKRQLDESHEFIKYWIVYLTDRIRDLSSRVND